MSDRSAIEWTDATWNPVRGCTKVSPGCKHCYAETFAERFRGVPGHPYEQGFDLRLVPEKLARAAAWRRPRRVFVNSMSDLFHEDVPDDYIDAWSPGDGDGRLAHLPGAHQAPRADARPADRAAARSLAELPHVWWGVSVEDRQHGLPRIEHLRHAPARLRFLSVEPLLEDLGRARPERHRLGDRRRRERPRRAADATRSGCVAIRDQCRAAERAVLLQAVGRRAQDTKPAGSSTAAPTMSSPGFPT